jgi:hypothetical protein
VSGATERTIDELRAENARLWAENNRLRAVRAEEDALRRQIAHMEGSLSWQVTAPLRAAKTLYVKVQRRLDATGG